MSADEPGPRAWERAATALVLAHLLAESDVRARGRAAAQRVRARLDAPGGVDGVELAGFLADAEVVSAARPNAPVDEEVRAALADAGVPADIATRAVEAAAASARMRALAEALDGPRRAEALERGLRVLDRAALEAEPAREGVARAASSAALARAAAAALDERLAEHVETVSAFADDLRAGAGPGERLWADPAADEVARRLADTAAERVRQADRLAEALLARAKPEVAPLPPPFRPEAEQLVWLREFMSESLYTDQDARDGANWLGSDPFRLRELPPPLDVLAGIDSTALPPEHVAPLLRWLDVARADARCDLEPFEVRAPGAVSRSARTGSEIPRILHAVWLGGVPRADSAFLRNLGYVARRYAGELDVVLWTDRTRRDAVGQPGTSEARRLASWAADHGVALVDIFEVFHADAPMITHPQYVLEMAKQLPLGYAAASDLVRLEVVHRFGGVYADGDLEYADQHRDPAALGPRPESPVEFLDRLADSELGFTMDPLPRGGIGNDIAAGPARHRVIRLWLEETRVNYFRSHAQIFGGLTTMALPYVGENRCAMRYVAPNRTGRIHHRVLALLGLTGPELPATQPPFRFNSAGSWIPAPDGGFAAVAEQPAPVDDEDDQERVVGILARTLTVLEWQSAAREGDLYLAGVDPVVRTLPDPQAAWIALLSVLPSLPGGVEITSVTDVRRRDDRVVERVELPPEAHALIDRRAFGARTDGTPVADWLGAGLSVDGGAVWLVDERVEAARLRAAAEPAPSMLDVFGPLTEVAYDLAGYPVGLWIRPADDATARIWRRPERFAGVPRGWIGVSAGGPPGWDWCERWPLDAETLARLLLGAGVTGRPVLISAPWERKAAVSQLAARLGPVLRQQVEVVEGPLRVQEARSLDAPYAMPSRTMPVHTMPLRYLPWSSVQSRGSVESGGQVDSLRVGDSA